MSHRNQSTAPTSHLSWADDTSGVSEAVTEASAIIDQVNAARAARAQAVKRHCPSSSTSSNPPPAGFQQALFAAAAAHHAAGSSSGNTLPSLATSVARQLELTANTLKVVKKSNLSKTATSKIILGIIDVMLATVDLNIHTIEVSKPFGGKPSHMNLGSLATYLISI